MLRRRFRGALSVNLWPRLEEVFMRFGGLLALAVAAGALSWQGQAQAAPLTVGEFITLGTTTVTLVDCPTCDGSTMEFVPGPGPARSFIIEAINPANHL